MSLRLGGRVAVVFALLISSQSAGGEGQFIKSIDPISGWGWIIVGRVMKSPTNDTLLRMAYIDRYNYNEKIFQRVEIGVRTGATVSPRSKVCIHLGGVITFPSLTNSPDFEKFRQSFTPYMVESSISTLFGDTTLYSLQTKLGYFSVKYNYEAQNLGEYLFRSGTYPGFLYSGFEIADKVKILGVKINNSIFGNFTQNLYIFSQINMPPLYDISLGYVLDYKPWNFLSLGAGGCFASLITADKYETTFGYDTIKTRKVSDPLYRYIDTTKTPFDTVLYTFRGIKLMARAALDIKPLIGLQNRGLGAQELKLYSEAALLGVKNYPFWYEKRQERIPIMIGINLPVFRSLDVLSFELEWYGCKYRNSTENIWANRSAVPYNNGRPRMFDDAAKDYQYATSDNIKWSLYGSKKLSHFFRISAQVASDHLRLWSTERKDYDEVLKNPDDWYGAFKLMYMF